MELMVAIRERRSIRKFKKQKVSGEKVAHLIEAASYAPSAGNIQPWEFVVVKKQTVKKKLAEATYNQDLITNASVVIVVCADEKRSSMGYGSRGRTLYCLQDTAAATQNILLTAQSLGLGACWVGSFNEDEVREAVKAPEGVRPVIMIPIGYPEVIPRKRIRRFLSEMVHYDSF